VGEGLSCREKEIGRMRKKSVFLFLEEKQKEGCHIICLLYIYFFIKDNNLSDNKF